LQLSNGSTFFANLKNITLPHALVGAVTGVVGLDDAARPQSQLESAVSHTGHATTAKAATPALGPIAQSGGASPCVAALAGAGYTAPQLASAYNFNGLYKQGYLGQGMSIALVEFDDYHDSNVNEVESCYGLHTPVSRVVVDGGTGGGPHEGEGEDMADITTILEMLPKLKHLYVYVAPITSFGEVDLFNRFVVDHKAPVMSASWGNCEELNSAADNRLYEMVTEEAAAQGQQIFTASGDSGAVDCRGYPTPTKGSVSVEQEAAVPWVTGVGGTDLGQNTANGISPSRDEDSWNSDGSGGGGVSTLYPMPSWQYSLKSARTAPGRSSALCGAAKGKLCREIPDISADADPGAGQQGAGVQFKNGDVGSLGYSIYCGTPNCSLVGVLTGLPIPSPGGLGGWEPVGGTSLSTPLTASAALLWDQEAKAHGLSSYGLLNPSLYQDAASPARYARDFHDITTDSNSDQYDSADCPAGCNPKHLYQAAPGYDMATGLGSYDATNLGADLVKLASRVALSERRVSVYGYTKGVATTSPVVVSSGAHAVAYQAHSNRKWLHVKSGKSTGKLHWSVSPKGLKPGTYKGTIAVRAHGHRTALAVVYSVTRPAKLVLSTKSLEFGEPAWDSKAQPTTATCGDTLWGDELFDDVNESTGTKVPATSEKILKIKNGGLKRSVLHWQAFPYSDASGWLSTPITRGSIQTKPSRPLVPTDGTEKHGQVGDLRLASLANSNALGGYPRMNQGTYRGAIKVVDLADPKHVQIVQTSLRLGTGKHTPTVRASVPSTISLGPSASTTVTLKISNSAAKSCGFDYSVSSNHSWAVPNAEDYSGTVAATGSGAVGGSDTGSGTGAVPVVISAKGLSKGTHVLTLTIQSENAAPNPVTKTIKVKVT
jgi:kumamolisin